MNKKINFTAICLTVCFLVVLSACSENQEKILHISGSTTIAPFMKKVAAQFKKKMPQTLKLQHLDPSAG